MGTCIIDKGVSKSISSQFNVFTSQLRDKLLVPAPHIDLPCSLCHSHLSVDSEGEKKREKLQCSRADKIRAELG